MPFNRFASSLTALSFLSCLAACADKKPIEQTTYFHAPESPQLLADQPTRKKNFRERLYDGLRNGDTSTSTYVPARDPGMPPPTPNPTFNGY